MVPSWLRILIFLTPSLARRRRLHAMRARAWPAADVQKEQREIAALKLQAERQAEQRQVEHSRSDLDGLLKFQ